MSLASNVSLIVAELGLAEVQSITQAMHRADAAVAAANAVTSVSGAVLPPAASYQSGAPRQPEPTYAPRRVIHPEPRYEARPVIHPAPRVEPWALRLSAVCPQRSHITPSPIQPPWAVLPWQEPPQPAVKIKVVVRPPDNHGIGRLVDCFI